MDGDEERPSAMRHQFMPTMPAFHSQLGTTAEEGFEQEQPRPSRVRATWNAAANTAERGLKNMLALARHPLQIEKKPQGDQGLQIGNSKISDRIKTLLRQYDVNGDDTLDVDEVTALVEHLLKEERQGRKLRTIIIGMIVFTCVLLAAMTGLTYVVVAKLKDTEVSNNYILIAKGSDQPVQTANMDFTVVDGTMVTRTTGPDPSSPPPSSTSNALRTSAYTGTQQALNSQMDIDDLVELNFFHVTSPTGSLALKVTGVARVAAPQSQYGTVVQILTAGGTITLDGDIISFEDAMEPIFLNAGVLDNNSSGSRRMLLQDDSTDLSGRYNRLVDVPVAPTPPNQEIATAWQIAAASKDQASAASDTIQTLKDNNAPDQMFASMWADYKRKNNKRYGTLAADKDAFDTWKKNLQPVIDTNTDNTLPYWASPNEYSDMEYNDFVTTYLIKQPLDLKAKQEALKNTGRHRRLVERYNSRRRLMQNVQPKPYVNWTAEGKVTPVKSQGGCGSCWTFAAVGALESAYLIVFNLSVANSSDNSVIDLSEQQFVSCVNSGTNPMYQSTGCDGGDPLEALSYAFSYNVTTNAVLPYTSGNTGDSGVCDIVTLRSTKLKQVVQTGEDSEYAYPWNDETSIMMALMQQPLAMYFMVDDTFINYAGGIYTPTTCGTTTNHNMLLVGYDTRGPIPFWIVRNQWGTGWGEQGYARIIMTHDENGPCGMYGFTAYPPLDFVKALGRNLTSVPPPPSSG